MRSVAHCFTTTGLVLVAACGATEPRVEPDAAADPAAGPAAVAEASTRRQPLPTQGSFQRANGLRLLLVDAEHQTQSRLSLWIEAGPAYDPKGRPGIAVLTAASLRASGAGGRIGTSLGETLESLAAKLDITIEGRWVRIEASCPAVNTVALAQTIQRFVTQDRPSEAVVRSERKRLLRELIANRDQRQRDLELELQLGETAPTLELEEAALTGYESASVRFFMGLHYRPNRSVLVLQLPGNKAQRSSRVESIAKIFDPWTRGLDPEGLTQPNAVRPLAFVPKSTETAEILVAVPSPEPSLTGNARREVLWQLLDLGGVGGTLRTRLDAAGFRALVPETFEFVTGYQRVRVLRFVVMPNQVAIAVEAVRSAFKDLADREPDDAAVLVARARTSLLWDRRLAIPEQRFAALARAHVNAGVDDCATKVEASIDAIRPEELPGLAQASFVPAVLVRGPESARPKDAAELPEALQNEITAVAPARLRPLELDSKARAALRDATTERARNHLGGKTVLAAKRELAWVARCTYVGAIPFTETWTVGLPNGSCERVRRLLGTTIKTTLTAKGCFESAGRLRRTLTDTEAEFFRLESALNPIALFAREATGRLRFRLAGKAVVDGRELLILEGTLESGQDIQLGVDRATGLPRQLAYDEWQPKSRPLRIELRFEDYRSLGALRAPHRIRRLVEGQFRGEAEIMYTKKD